MQFLKQNRKYLTQQLLGNISNIVRFQIKDLYKAPKSEQFQICKKCQSLLSFKKCSFCGQTSQQVFVNQAGVRNSTYQKTTKKQHKTLESMILCIDLSGSMQCSYPTKYKKINKDFIIRSIGQKNFTAIKSVIGQDEVIKNFKGIQMLILAGQNIRDIAFTFKEEIQREKLKDIQNNKQKSSQNEEISQYITRKQIIEIGVSKYIQQIKKERPNTLITVVYFNSHIQIPIDNYSDKIIIPGLQDKTIEQMIQLGQHYADKISIIPVSQIGQKLIENMNKSQANGQTALSPAITFCLGLTRKFKHDLHQIIVVTDGLSNIGFAQTQQQSQISQSKNIYKQLALNYAIPNSCVINVIGFEDCAMSYDVIDQLVSKTGGIPYNIGFSQEKKQKIVTNQTIDFLNLQMITGFCQSTSQFCYETKISIKASNPNIKLSLHQEYKKFIKYDQGNVISLYMGIKSINDKFDVCFTVEDQKFNDQFIKFSVINQYKRKNKKNYVLREQLISVRNGIENEAIKDQSLTLAKQIQNKLKVHNLEQVNFQEYQELQQKIDQNAKISQNIDERLLEQFKKKKQIINEYQKNTDKLTKDKRTMMSRRHQTYKRRQVSSDQQSDEGDGFL